MDAALVRLFSKNLRMSAIRRNGVSLESYPVPTNFAERAYIGKTVYERIYESSIASPDGFWREQAKFLDWIKPFSEVSDTNFDAGDFRIRWFAGGTLNASFNCLDRHLPAKTHEAAILWESDTQGESRVVTWNELSASVNRLANVLKSLGVKKSDVVAIYLPVIPEVMVAMMAAVRIGAVHTVVFSGFSPDSLANRIRDSGDTATLAGPFAVEDIVRRRQLELAARQEKDHP
jgi:acetyl-CoA synthetase